jgi:hypothetical protein
MLLARGRRTSAAPQTLEAWLHDAFALEAPLAAGAFTLLGAGDSPGDASWVRADPVHLRLMRDHLVVVPAAAFALSREEAAALCESLTQHFAGTAEFRAIDAQRWCARLEREVEAAATPALELAGREVELARGGNALLTEIQMLLHAHPVNEAREERGEPAVNSVWLWGAGRAPRVARPPWQSVSSDDPLVLGLARAAELRHRALAPGVRAWLERAPEDGRHLVVLEGLRTPLALAEPAEVRAALEALEREWFAPLLEALRAGRVGMVTLHVPDAAGCASFEAIRGDLRRFWRRPKALVLYT